MKKSIAPFKMIPVSVRDRLHELTGSELKVWLAVVLHSDANREAFPSNGVLMKETGLTHTTLAKAKQGLRSKKWFTSAQRYRENGSLSSMGEKWHIPETRGDVSLKSVDIPTNDSGMSSPQLLGEPEVDTLEVDTGKPDTSNPQDQSLLVSKSVSEVTLATLATSFEREKQKPQEAQGALPEHTKPSDDLWNRESEQSWLAQERIPYWSEELKRGLDTDEVGMVQELYLDLILMGKMDEGDIVTLAELTTGYGQAYIRGIWHWNKLHKKDSLVFRTIQGMAKAMRSESDNNVCIQYQEHNVAECSKCKKLRKCIVCKRLEDCTIYRYAPLGEYIHKHCEFDWLDMKYRPIEMPPLQIKAEPVGKGFEYEPSEQPGDCAHCMGYGRTVCICEGDPDDVDLTPDDEYASVAKGGFDLKEI